VRLSSGRCVGDQDGFAILPSAAACVLDIDLTGLGVREGDRDFCLRAVNEAGVAAIPVSAFYEVDRVTSIVRLCFSKADATLDEGVARLAKAREGSRAGV
jgi:aspartate/methionine/tyrosine aminotransferase